MTENDRVPMDPLRTTNKWYVDTLDVAVRRFMVDKDAAVRQYANMRPPLIGTSSTSINSATQATYRFCQTLFRNALYRFSQFKIPQFFWSMAFDSTAKVEWKNKPHDF